jgi:hypothetical protein
MCGVYTTTPAIYVYTILNSCVISYACNSFHFTMTQPDEEYAVDGFESKEAVNPISDTSSQPLPSTPTQHSPVSYARNTINVLLASLVSLFVAFIALFNNRVSNLREVQLTDDNRKLIDDSKALIAQHRAQIERERTGVHNIERTIQGLVSQLRNCKHDQLRTKKIRSEIKSLWMTKRTKESMLFHSVTEVESVEQTLSQIEQFSMSMERHNQMRPLIKNIGRLMPTRSHLQKLKAQKLNLMESARKMNSEMTEINLEIIQSGEEYFSEQVDGNAQMNHSIEDELDAVIEQMEEAEASRLVLDMPSTPISQPLMSHSTPHSNYVQVTSPKAHEANHTQSQPLMSEYASME